MNTMTDLTEYGEQLAAFGAMRANGQLDVESYAEACDALVNAVSVQHGSKAAAELVSLILTRNGNVKGL